MLRKQKTTIFICLIALTVSLCDCSAVLTGDVSTGTDKSSKIQEKVAVVKEQDTITKKETKKTEPPDQIQTFPTQPTKVENKPLNTNKQSKDVPADLSGCWETTPPIRKFRFAREKGNKYTTFTLNPAFSSGEIKQGTLEFQKDSVKAVSSRSITGEHFFVYGVIYNSDGTFIMKGLKECVKYDKGTCEMVKNEHTDDTYKPISCP